MGLEAWTGFICFRKRSKGGLWISLSHGISWWVEKQNFSILHHRYIQCNHNRMSMACNKKVSNMVKNQHQLPHTIIVLVPTSSFPSWAIYMRWPITHPLGHSALARRNSVSQNVHIVCLERKHAEVFSIHVQKPLKQKTRKKWPNCQNVNPDFI